MKRILINATQKEELRVAIVDGQKLLDLDIETPSAGRKKGNIYKGVIARVEPGLDAAFVDYGDPKHGFLPFREISQAYLKNKQPDKRADDASVAKSLHQGQAVLVQVQREGHGGKGAALTTFISIAGRYLVLMPNAPRGSGVSRRAGDKERDETRRVLSQLDVPEDGGVIIRTKGVGRDLQLLQRDLDYLKKLWGSIVSAAKDRPAPFLVYAESNIVICALRDYFSDDTEEIIVDDEAVFSDARDFIKLVIPGQTSKLKLYQEPVPLFSRYHVESQIESAFDHEISLPSGGSIVFDRTEALLSIDINSGKATRGSNIEETALNTNLEAAEEIARQLRLRDLGGLIVIDFIDMMPAANRRAVESHLYKATSRDQARVQFERISRFGLLEMSRQRMRPSLGESSHVVCPQCGGKGSIRTLESSALATLRMMEEEAMKEKSGRVVAQLPLEITSFLLNEKRENINEIESRHGVQIMIVPDAHMQIPHFQIRRYRLDDKENRDKFSYEMITARKPALSRSHAPNNGHAAEKPAVGPAVNFMDAKAARSRRKGGVIAAISSLFRKKAPSSAQPQGQTRGEKRKATSEERREEGGHRRRRRGGRRRGGARNRQRQDTQTAEPRTDERPEPRETSGRRGAGRNRRSDDARRSPPKGETKEPRDFREPRRERRDLPPKPAVQPELPAPPPYATDAPGDSDGPPPQSVTPLETNLETKAAPVSTETAPTKPESKPESDPENRPEEPPPTPRFSKPANLVQVETKNTPGD